MEKASTGEVQHDFGALNTLLFVTILGMCIVCAYLIKEYKFYYLPESGAAMIVGLIVGAWTIMLYAVVGTMISTFMVGFLTFYAGKMEWIAIDSSSPLEALLFGALISAVDPVATLSILGNPELNLDPLLYSLVFGESVLNDAVSIVLFNTFLKFEESGKEFTYGAIWMLMFEFIMISLGSVVVGFVTGLGCSLLCKNTNLKKYPKYEITMLFLFAYGSYSLAEVMKLSGIMSLFFCGITMAHYNTTNLSSTSQITAESIFQSFALTAEFFVFLYMGMGICVGQFGRWDFKFMVLAIIFCLVSRLFNIYPLSWLANWKRKEKVSMQMQTVLWFAGLRGAMAFALSQDMPGANRDLYTTTTLSVVIFTTIVCGGLTEPLLKKTKLKIDEDELDEFDEEYGLISTQEVSDHQLSPESPGVASIRRMSVESEPSYVESFWGNVDDTYMKPIFGGISRRPSSHTVSTASLSPPLQEETSSPHEH
ncbi:hypothetical protein LEN26_009082 [Aphanomyces euteiches]|nr:hypothetical protein AeMF1_014112 [Aphanomyces euteiches]KAH9128676.1 hypothetical protein LEN26_009082 [Aphanomyces euteiches]KAH9131868.1 hypothetical protein AeRB84_021583 [Aphanomyces euteiches]KAH9186103.1 hypothetical protein AeNC1_011921 [Aphanomyces euteiches]